MKLVQRALWLAHALALCAAAQPTIGTNGIVNGAGFVYEGLPNGDIALGSIFSIFGSNLGPIGGLTASSFPLSISLGGVSVQVTPTAAGSASTNAILLYAAAGQINAILPSSVPVGTADVTVTFNGTKGNAQQINVVKNSFGIFAANQAGSGPAALNNYVSDSSQPQNSPSTPAHPGQVVILWGTGLGGVAFDETTAPGSNAKDLTDQTGAMVYVAGIAVKPQYAGRSPQFAGEDQINFEIPADMALACYVPVTVKVNGVVSNSTTLSIAAEDAAACSDDFTPLPSTLSQSLSTGSIVLTSTSTSVAGLPLKTDNAVATFTRIAAADVGKLQAADFGLSTYGACTVFVFKGSNPQPADNVPVTYLDPGHALTLTLPDKTTKTLTQSTQGVYTITPTLGQTLPPFLVPGTYKIEGAGGSGPNFVGVFSATLTVPTVLTWTNIATISPISRNTPVRLTWTGGDPSDAVVINGYSVSASSSQVGAGFYCLARVGDQQFTIPADVLLQMPTTGTGFTPGGYLAIGEIPTLEKSKVSGLPTGLDTLVFLYNFGSAAEVTYQ